MAENLPIDWIEELVVAEAVPTDSHPPIFNDFHAIGYRAWSHWDLRLAPGRYKVARVASVIHKKDFLPYFYAGTVSKRYRVAPMRPIDRFAAFTQHEYDKAILGQPLSVDTWNAPCQFKVPSSEVIYRFEARQQMWEVNNPNPLPADCRPWVTFVQTYREFNYVLTYQEWAGYGWDNPGLCRMAYDANNSIVFWIEGGGEVDFQELAIQVFYVGE